VMVRSISKLVRATNGERFPQLDMSPKRGLYHFVIKKLITLCSPVSQTGP